MLKLTGPAGNVKDADWMPKAKYIITTTTLSNPREQVSNISNISSLKSSLYINELGKQLLVAAASGNVAEIKYLLSKGAPFTADWLGTSPLHLAAQNNHLSAVEELLKAGISKDARTKVDRTPLHMAAYEGHLSIVDALIRHGADIECRDLLEMTPLHWAAQNGHLEIVEHLLKCGADADVTNKFDLTPASIAKQINRADVVNALESSSASRALAAENLVIELEGEAGHLQNGSGDEAQEEADDVEMEESLVIPLEPSIINRLRGEEEDSADESEINQEAIEITNDSGETLMQNQSSLSDSLKLLEAHGITMLENESNDTSILNSAMESGHSVVLTDVGKEVLDSVKRSVEQKQSSIPKDANVITVAAAEGESMDMEGDSPSKDPSSKPLRFRRVIIKKNVGFKEQLATIVKEMPSDMELVMNQLIEAKKTISELKTQLQQKELEAERYKMQLKLLMDSS